MASTTTMLTWVSHSQLVPNTMLARTTLAEDVTSAAFDKNDICQKKENTSLLTGSFSTFKKKPTFLNYLKVASQRWRLSSNILFESGGGTDVNWLFTESAGCRQRKLALCPFITACFLSSSPFLLPFFLLALLCTLSCPVMSGPLWTALVLIDSRSDSEHTHVWTNNDKAVFS